MIRPQRENSGAKNSQNSFSMDILPLRQKEWMTQEEINTGRGAGCEKNADRSLETEGTGKR